MPDKPNSSVRHFMTDDDLSLDSSASEEQEVYTVEEILAERLSDDSEILYLVKWEGYPEERCTWEPAESFLNPQGIQHWIQTRDAGKQPAESVVERIDAKLNTYKAARSLRQLRRRNKRRKLAAMTRLSSSPAKTKPTPHLATSLQNPQDLNETKRRPSTTGPIPSDTAKTRTPSTTNKIPIKPSLVHTKPRPTLDTSTAKQSQSVFHGISPITTSNKSGNHARRTGTQRSSKKASFRNLRHTNNVRKVLRRERSPDVTKIRLRSLAEWAESAPEDTNMQLTPLSIPSMSSADNGRQAGDKLSLHEGTIASRTHPDKTSLRESITFGKMSMAPNDFRSSKQSGIDEMPTRNRIDMYEGQERTLRTVASGRFYYFPGDILVELKFGKAHIGDVRITGLPPWAIGQIIKCKTSNLLRLEIGSNDVVSPAQWAQLCTGRSNVLQTTGKIVPFHDTAGAVSQMERYLYQQTLAALWYHPTDDTMLVFYSPESKPWMFLERMGGLPFDRSIRVLTRNKIPPTEMLAVDLDAAKNIHTQKTDQELEHPITRNAPYATNPRAPASSIISDNYSSVTTPRPSMHQSAGTAKVPASAIASREQPPKPATCPPIYPEFSPHDGNKVPVHRSDVPLPPPLVNGSDGVQTNVAEAGTKSLQIRLQPGQTISDAFADMFQFSYDYLTAVPASKNVDRDPAKARFYLVYPRGAEAELGLLEKFLRSHTFQTNICTSLQRRGWDAFRNIYRGDYIGVLLFHQDCLHFHTLPQLASLLRSPSLNVFRVSLSTPLRFRNDKSHVERLFPSGTAILITEASMISHGLSILRWFSRKKRPGWILVLRPSIKHWLRQRALESAVEVRDRFHDMLQELEKLSPGFSTLRHHSHPDGEASSKTETIDGLGSEPGGPGTVFAPSFIPAYDRPPPSGEEWSSERWKENVLIEYFAGWSVAHAELHRKFIAVATMLDKGYSKWGHIEVLRPEKFMERERIELKPQLTD